jgi:hypothetical protein
LDGSLRFDVEGQRGQPSALSSSYLCRGCARLPKGFSMPLDNAEGGSLIATHGSAFSVHPCSEYRRSRRTTDARARSSGENTAPRRPGSEPSMPMRRALPDISGSSARVRYQKSKATCTTDSNPGDSNPAAQKWRRNDAERP